MQYNERYDGAGLSVRGLERIAILITAAAFTLVGCSGGSGDQKGRAAPFTCSVAQQKASVLDLMQEWYLFNDEPEQQQKYVGLNIDQFATPEALLESLLYRSERFDRNFSFLTTAAQDQQFFGEGQFVGYGFGSKFVDAPLNTDLRLVQVIAGSPAEASGFARGQRLLTINGRSIAEIVQAEGLGAALGPDQVGVVRTFGLQRPDGSEFSIDATTALVTIDPLPGVATLSAGATLVGYLDFRTFVATADNALEQAFATFEDAGVTALIVDLRYNGGGLVSTAHRLGDLIGGFIADNQVQTQTVYNSAKSALNTTTPFRLRSNSLSLLQQVVFITTSSSASASELVINGLEPHVLVRVVGEPTFGKPVGQGALSYCAGERLLRGVTFEIVNSLGQGQYYDGLLVDCPAADELERTLGDPLETSLATALTLIETGGCPVAAAPLSLVAKSVTLADLPREVGDTSASRYAGIR